MLFTIFISIFISCEDTGVQRDSDIESSTEKQEALYPSKMMYYPEDNLKCRSIAPMHAECWDINPKKE